MNSTLIEIAEFTGRACGTVARDLADLSQPLAEAVARGWREGWQPSLADQTTKSQPDYSAEAS